MSGFYESYGRFKRYQTPGLSKKVVKRLDAEVWIPASCQASHSFLELGCGTGQFLAYLAAKGAANIVGIDHDPELAQVIPETAKAFFRRGDILQLIEDQTLGLFDRIFLFDVLEHFSPDQGCALLTAARQRLAPGGKVVLKVPNAASPWGIQYQYGDLTHKTAYTPLSLRQMAEATGFTLEGFYAPMGGSPRRRITEALLNGFLGWALTQPPDLFSANMYGILSPRG
ncbi:MAG: class I SAM-dependent methyltransferase [Rhodospirillales bacterium]|nr:class I SAM-dependent methyltransferase [Rhodospirillales bacterium]